MTRAVVDALEAVEIEAYESQGATVTPRQRDRLLKGLIETAPVGEAGEIVYGGDAGDGLVCLLELRSPFVYAPLKPEPFSLNLLFGFHPEHDLPEDHIHTDADGDVPERPDDDHLRFKGCFQAKEGRRVRNTEQEECGTNVERGCRTDLQAPDDAHYHDQDAEYEIDQRDGIKEQMHGYTSLVGHKENVMP